MIYVDPYDLRLVLGILIGLATITTACLMLAHELRNPTP